MKNNFRKQKIIIASLLAVLVLVSAIFLVVRYHITKPAENRVFVYFVNYDEQQNKPYLVPFVREIQEFSQIEDKVEGAMTELLKGPNETEIARGTSTAVPEGVKLLGVRIDGQTAYIDFSRDLEEGGGSMLMLERLAQIVYTATQFNRVKDVMIQLDGTFIEYFSGEGITDVAYPMDRDNFKYLFR